MEDDVFSVFIAEDEQPARDLLLDYIFKRSELKMEGWSKNGQETYDKLSRKEYDLVFLDINMPQMSGIDVLEKLENPPYVIFTTAYDEYAIKAFELGAVDYLLKPFSQERFNSAIDKAISVIRNKGPYTNTVTRIGLSFKEGENHFLISYDDVIYLSSEGRHSLIHTKTKVYNTAQSLKALGQKLPADIFFRIHKQYIVNLKYISHMQYLIGGQYMAFLKDAEKTTLTVGRMYASALRGKLTD
ncbi:MAG: LytTR family DNA-binding domain-containing protein [Spirochaetota bacterium]